MKTFDWTRFFSKHNVYFVTSGRNVAKGNIAIKCPFCGEADPSQHMGINLETGAWGCWRDATHRGRKPHKLIMAILKCSQAEAAAIVGDVYAPDLSEYDAFVKDLQEWNENRKDTNNAKKRWTPPKPIEFLPEFRKLHKANYSSARFFRYLSDRGFSYDVAEVASFYSLHGCLIGDWKDRIIVPIYHRGRLVSWTGRSIYKTAKLRYKTLSVNEGASVSIKDVIFEPRKVARGGDVLFVTEGPFDALKVDFYAKSKKCRATCLFGVGYTEKQVYQIRNLSRFFKKVVILFDHNAATMAFSLQRALKPCNAIVGELPEHVSDPGDMSRRDVIFMCERHV